MNCTHLVDSENKIVGHICRAGESFDRPLRKRHRTKWCFNCRKRLPHMLTATIEKEPSYYDPQVWWKCSGCGYDYTLFPGTGYL